MMFHSNSKQPSSVLTAMGVLPEDAFSAVRFSLGWWATEEEIDTVIKAVADCFLKRKKY
ncbi:MAG: hypothetical protein AB1498_01345 [bacterium]